MFGIVLSGASNLTFAIISPPETNLIAFCYSFRFFTLPVHANQSFFLIYLNLFNFEDSYSIKRQNIFGVGEPFQNSDIELNFTCKLSPNRTTTIIIDINLCFFNMFHINVLCEQMTVFHQSLLYSFYIIRNQYNFYHILWQL